MLKPLKSLITLSFTLSTVLMIATNAQAQNDKVEQINLEQSTQHTMVEIANLQVFKEICPSLIGTNRHLDHGIHTMLKHFLPDFKDPVLALKALNEEDYYQPVLQEARKEVANATREDNRQVCLSIVNWDKTQNNTKK